MMPCRITDEYYKEYDEAIDEELPLKSMNELSLYELMADEYDVWLKKDKQFGFNLEINDWDGKLLIQEKNIHPAAAEGFAVFCRAYLACYEKESSSC
jgi:hypothetical protein